MAENLCTAVIFFLFLWKASALDCGYPGKPANGHVNVSDVSGIHFPPRTVASFSCLEPHFLLRGHRSVRICQENGLWTGSRPWCDTNIAFEKKTKFFIGKENRDEPSVTDGNIGALNNQSCPTLGPGNDSIILIDLGHIYNVSSVTIHLEDRQSNVESGRLLLDTEECTELNQTNERIKYECMATNNGHPLHGRHVVFKYSDSDPLNVCEIQVFKTPNKFACGIPEVPANSHFTLTAKGRFMFVEYECQEGFQLNGHNKRICHGTHWHGLQPVCELKSPVELKDSAKEVEDFEPTAEVRERFHQNASPNPRERKPAARSTMATMVPFESQGIILGIGVVVILLLTVAVLMGVAMICIVHRHFRNSRRKPSQEALLITN